MSIAAHAPTVQYYKIDGVLVAAAVFAGNPASAEQVRGWAHDLRDEGKVAEFFWISDLFLAPATTYLAKCRPGGDCQIISPGDALVRTTAGLQVWTAPQFWAKARVLQ